MARCETAKGWSRGPVRLRDASGTNTPTLVILTALLAVASFARVATAQDVSGFGNIKQGDARPSDSAAEKQWQPVQTDKLSIVNLAPVLLPFFNNGPVFGIPGTMTGSLSKRTQLSGDWGGARTRLASKGLFVDFYTTSALQNIASGGLDSNDAFVQNTQISINLDTGRAGLWKGGLIHFTLQSRYGATPEESFSAGTSVPQYVGHVLPGPTLSSDFLPSEYFLVQPLSKQFSIVAGKTSNIFIPDQTMIGNSYKYYFANFNFNKNAMTPNFYNPTSLAALAIWAPSTAFAVAGGVLDPYTEADNFAKNAFDHVNLYLTTVSNYSIAGRPGQLSPAFNWSNKPKMDLENPFGTLSPVLIPRAVGALLGSPALEGLPINFKDHSWFSIANVSQYLYVKDARRDLPQKLKSGQVIDGVGLFARVGFAPDDTNTITRDASVAMFAHGLVPNRTYDSFGAGLYYNTISDNTKAQIARYTRGADIVENEKGVEAFYDFAIIPSIRLIASYQHVWNPLIAETAKKEDKTNVFLTRLTVAW